jgi:hypothetical protein
MKCFLTFILILIVNSTFYAQDVDRDKEMRETINWLNKQLRDHISRQKYVFKDIVFVNGEPIMYVQKSHGTCTNTEEIEQIPINKIKPIRYEEIVYPRNYFNIYFETKNGEEIIWYQNDDKSCGQIGDYTFLTLSSSIKEDNLLNRFNDAILYLMNLYGNDGKEKF